MPKYPIYLPFLSEQAQQVVGKTHDNTQPALAMLKSEGFNFNGLVDIFDAGPLVEAFVGNIRAVRQSRLCDVEVKQVDGSGERDGFDKNPWLIANTQFQSFRALLVDNNCLVNDSALVNAGGLENKRLLLNREQADLLQVSSGDQVRIVALKEARPSQTQAQET